MKLRPTQHDVVDFVTISEGGLNVALSLIGQAGRFFDRVLEKGDLQGNEINLSKLKA